MSFSHSSGNLESISFNSLKLCYGLASVTKRSTSLDKIVELAASDKRYSRRLAKFWIYHSSQRVVDREQRKGKGKNMLCSELKVKQKCITCCVRDYFLRVKRHLTWHKIIKYPCSIQRKPDYSTCSNTITKTELTWSSPSTQVEEQWLENYNSEWSL